MSDAIIISLIGALATVIVAIAGGFVSYKISQMSKDQKIVASKVQEVAIKLEDTTKKSDEKLEGLTKVTSATHNWVNGSFGVLLQKYADLAFKFYDLTRSKSDLVVAKDAQKAADEHIQAQPKV